MKKSAGAPRIYEYVSEDGTIYWSLSPSSQTVSIPTRLYLQDKRGLLLPHFLGILRLRAIAEQAGAAEDEVVG